MFSIETVYKVFQLTDFIPAAATLKDEFLPSQRGIRRQFAYTFKLVNSLVGGNPSNWVR